MSHARRKMRKKLAKMRAISTQHPHLAAALEEVRVPLSFEQAVKIEDLLKEKDPVDPLIRTMQDVQRLITDDVHRRHEIESREKSSAWWDRPQHWVNDEIERDRKAFIKRKQNDQKRNASKRSRRKKEKEIAAQSAEELNGNRHVVAAGVHLPSDVVEDVVDLGNREPVPEHAGSLGPAVSGNEAQDLEGVKVDGGGDGLLEVPAVGSGLVLPLPVLDDSGGAVTLPDGEQASEGGE